MSSRAEHQVVSNAEWLEQRRRLLAKEREFTRLRDELTAERQRLPWERVEKAYGFEGEEGELSLIDLFGNNSQLVVYHFMFAPDWEVGCKSCSFWADNFNGISRHLEARDVSLVAISRAPYSKLAAFRERMGWSFTWMSSASSDFNFDFQVSFTPEAREAKTGTYNYRPYTSQSSEMPGVSVFLRRGDEVFHTYSTFARGLDILNGAYNLLDLTPKGRDENGRIMSWLRLRDSY
jgi:predicted dithiol-disulfide oxidoreductase (DUF899 family)